MMGFREAQESVVFRDSMGILGRKESKDKKDRPEMLGQME
jgi:hypothetical protein